MPRRIPTLLWAAAAAVVLATAAAAQPRPTMAIMPVQYFRADARSAANLTRALVERFQSEQYRVVPMDRARQLFERMGFSPDRPISDAAILQFGRRLGADLVAHPQLLAVHHWESRASEPEAPTARAVLYLRVLNTQTGRPLYTRQVAYSFAPANADGGTLVLSPRAAAGAAADVSRSYFERVAGSRQEFHSSTPR